jgi:hypothetical protein
MMIEDRDHIEVMANGSRLCLYDQCGVVSVVELVVAKNG